MVNFKQEVKMAFSENKWIIFASIFILIFSLILGFYLEPYLHSYFNPVVEDLSNKVETGVIQLTFHDIFLNNIMVVFRMFIFGIFFCFSALILAFNGFFVGYYAAVSDDLLRVSLLIIPHGIFEFSSCILACASGFILFKFVYKFIQTFFNNYGFKFGDKLLYAVNSNFDILKHALIILLVASVLMAVAGIVETYITLPLGYYLYSIFG